MFGWETDLATIEVTIDYLRHIYFWLGYRPMILNLILRIMIFFIPGVMFWAMNHIYEI